MSWGDILARLTERGETLGTVESLTAGLVVATAVDTPGASNVVRGGLITYNTELKATLADVPAETLERGVVTLETALAMARGGKERLGVTWCVSTTGVAGPGPHEGIPAGTVWIAVTGPVEASRLLGLMGNREAVRRQTVEAVESLMRSVLDLPTA